jgi:diguanylate cyclase (GGDEF)-like protein
LLGELRELAEAVSRVQSKGNVASHRDAPSSPAPGPRAGKKGARTPAAAKSYAIAAPKSACSGAPHLRADAVESAPKADPGLLGRLATAVTAGRQSRCPLSLLLVELDHTEGLLVALGADGFDALRRLLETACREVDHPGAICTPYGEAGFALILPNCERQQGVRLGDQLRRAMHRTPGRRSADARQPIALSVGVATVALPPKNFSPADLLQGADRCLYGSRASGGGVVKSIEIY